MKSQVFFFLRGKQKSPITNHAKPTLCKECNQKRMERENYVYSLKAGETSMQ